MTQGSDLPAAQKIRRARSEESELVGQILGSAFTDDPVINWISNDWYMGEALITTDVKTLYQFRGIVHINETGTGAALWLPPAVPHASPLHWRALYFAGRLIRHAGLSGAKRGMATEQVFAKALPREPHFYLHAIGAQLHHQGEGIGSALLKAGVQLADEANMPAYLESSNVRNNPLYERFGFEVTGEHTFAGGPTVWFMWRPASTD